MPSKHPRMTPEQARAEMARHQGRRLLAFFAEWKNQPEEWPEMGMYGARCGDCGMWMEIVRPGKEQCVYCGYRELACKWLESSDAG